MAESNETRTEFSNKFANDGSFLEAFKRKMEEEKKKTNDNKVASSTSNNKSEEQPNTVPKLPLVGKRRGSSKPLKTGIVMKKPKSETNDEESSSSSSGFAKYLEEVNKYKTKMCISDDKSRPLVK